MIDKNNEQKFNEKPYPKTLEKAIELYYFSYGNEKGGFNNFSLEKFKDIIKTFVEDYGLSAKLKAEEKSRLMKKCVHKAYQRGYNTGFSMATNEMNHKQKIQQHLLEEKPIFPKNWDYDNGQENKELLLKDLCARLPYGVKCTTNSSWNGIYNVIGYKDNRVYIDCPIYDEGDDEWLIESIKPYLRPMSTMTMEERKELGDILNNCTLSPYGEIKASGEDNILRCTAKQSFLFLNYMYKKHFDINHLIDEGLALEAPEGMYDINDK